MFNEIGSNYHLNSIEGITHTTQDYYIDSPKQVYLDTGRSAIRLALNNINDKRKVAILPMFTCHTVIQPFIEFGYEVSFYDVDTKFKVNKNKFEKLIGEVNPSVILVHAYFGFDTLIDIREYLKSLRESGTYIIEDITQSYFSNIDYETADFYVCSVRKWLAIPDGGFLKSSNVEIKRPSLVANDRYTKKQEKAMLLKGEYVNNIYPIIKEQYNKTFSEAKRIIDRQTNIYAMSGISRKLLYKSNIGEIKSRRKRNYRFLLQHLIDEKNIIVPLNSLGEDDTPLFFPIFIDNRLDFQKYMAKSNVYLPIIWPKSDLCLSEPESNSRYIYEKILCIPCDQRYNENDMERVVNLIKKYLKGEG
ncbi:DegT/DnrJ/EryC1/StrS family aminotransferase [Halobacillus sp. Nhm2S1]|uniref:DegT/DnrJ/EryC1/StrS family aminotransferase n=1 Tax=Halobacillus sp. Nhm2S1 TaxID=2866716 RepID=UPI001C72E7C0|nr:DegT/DnrJ/EryC1/StrS family aminotransferase [Halobacillus sp. Nhm2S1]MBX0357727.1 DegT/DnrJ/EryC1/StrS family aminotransferase [Halobacillus sp. Nhm2S1]